MSDGPDPKRLAELSKRIDAAKQADAPEPKEQNHVSQGAAAWRMVTELVIGMALGFGAGYGLDALFGTLPIFLVLLTLLGFAAGVRVMMRTAQEIQAEQLAAAKSAEADKK
jgi:ATP synthase protein I